MRQLPCQTRLARMGCRLAVVDLAGVEATLEPREAAGVLAVLS
jgi:hypothetical protein